MYKVKLYTEISQQPHLTANIFIDIYVVDDIKISAKFCVGTQHDLNIFYFKLHPPDTYKSVVLYSTTNYDTSAFSNIFSLYDSPNIIDILQDIDALRVLSIIVNDLKDSNFVKLLESMDYDTLVFSMLGKLLIWQDSISRITTIGKNNIELDIQYGK
jgi:hypothetical protein